MYTDLTYLEGFAEGNKEFIISMVDKFIQNTPKTLKGLDEAMQKEDLKQVRAVAHKLSSSTEIVGISSLKPKLNKIEDLAEEEKSVKKIKKLVAEVMEVCNASIRELEEKKSEL